MDALVEGTAGKQSEQKSGETVKPRDVDAGPRKQPDYDESTEPESWLSLPAQHARRAALGLSEGAAADFANSCQFISLGSHCAVARALQAMGLRSYAYPFDWLRTPVDGLIRCLDNDFEDFLTFTTQREDEPFQVFAGTRWGGSFWHHDPRTRSTREIFTRRIERFLGLGEVLVSTPRVFVRALNSTHELDSSLELHKALRRAFPMAPVYLVILIDLQKTQGPVRLAASSADGILFYRMHEDIYMKEENTVTLEDRSVAYTDAIAFAAKFWAKDEDVHAVVEMVEDIKQLQAACQQWHGGDASQDLFWPNFYLGQQLCFRKPVRLSLLLQEQTSEVQLPDNLSPGDTVTFNAFGLNIPIVIPQDVRPGFLLRLSLTPAGDVVPVFVEKT